MASNKKKMLFTCNVRLVGLILFLSLSAAHTGMAQNSSLELWPETDIWYRLNPSWRFSSFIPVSKNVETKYREICIIVQADYAWGHPTIPFFKRMMDESKAQSLKSWMVRPGFLEGWSLGDHGENYTEDMVFAELHKRMPLKGAVLLSHRLRTDCRWIGREADFSYRIRYRLMVEKEYAGKSSSTVPYVNVEPYWDSRYETVNRLRIIGGATVAWGKRFALEGNLTYQYDSRSSITNVYALNIILHMFFEATHANVKNE